MDVRHATLLRTVDPAALGDRLRAARTARGLTQAELAGDDLSVGYVSRIEAGHRRPSSKVLVELARRLDTPVDLLLQGVAPRELDEIRLTLDFAELSLESGEAPEAEARAGEVLQRAREASLEDMYVRARFIHARALEAQGRLDDAILEYESLVEESDGLLRVTVGISLSRSYRESGDLSRAIETAESILAQLDETGLKGSDEAVQLALSLSAAYFERGDTGHAVRLCRKAMARAEELGSPTARASAYWNASVLESERGAIGAAVPLAERALALLSEGQDARNLARLRTQLGSMQLRLDPPEVDAAREQLEQAGRDLEWSSAGTVDVAWNDVELARAQFLCGDTTAARELSRRVHDAVRTQAPLVAAEAKAMEGRAAAAEGDLDGAARAYQEAVHTLTGIGADRSAAQLWFDLAGLLEEVGQMDASRDAYRSAAASSGLQVAPRPVRAPARDRVETS
jgi:transcriptional regulator with XRE-family HTH domain